MSAEFPFDVSELVDDVMLYTDKASGYDRASVESMLKEALKLAEDKLYPAWRKSDTDGVRFVDGAVQLPELDRAAFSALAEWGWPALGLPEEIGGMEVPTPVYCALTEIFCGAHFPHMMCIGLTKPAARVLYNHGGERGITYAKRMAEGAWTGTMCLTEPSVGTALGDIKTKAVKQDDDSYHINGQKIWITFGDHGLPGIEICHLVLAKTPDAPSGTKGISLFAVPTVLEDGTKNGVKCIGIEEKLGLHGSPTCTMALGGDDVPCVGYLIGEECSGMRLMFEMMIKARIGVGIQALSNLSVATNLARDYAAERVQGVSIDAFKDPDAPRVTIDDHPPVKRMLKRTRVLARAMRHLVLHVASLNDVIAAGDKQAASDAQLLTPLVKGWCSNYSFPALSECMQIFGGNGYLDEFAIGQHMRDNRIAAIYEGTNEVQGLDLVGRQLPAEGGMRVMRWFQFLSESWEMAKDDDQKRAATIGQSAQEAISMVVLGLQGKTPREAVYNVTPILNAMGVTTALAILLRNSPKDALAFAEEYVPEVEGRMRFVGQA